MKKSYFRFVFQIIFLDLRRAAHLKAPHLNEKKKKKKKKKTKNVGGESLEVETSWVRMA